MTMVSLLIYIRLYGFCTDAWGYVVMFFFMSLQVREVMSTYDPNYCPMSLDEAYLDITDHMTKRCSMHVSERTYLLRKSNPGCTGKCECDLNETLRPSILQADNNVEELSSPNALDQKCEIDEEVENGLSVENTGNEELSGSSKDRARCAICGKPLPDYDVESFGISVEEAVREMRSRIEQRTRLTASAGKVQFTACLLIMSHSLPRSLKESSHSLEESSLLSLGDRSVWLHLFSL